MNNFLNALDPLYLHLEDKPTGVKVGLAAVALVAGFSILPWWLAVPATAYVAYTYMNR